MKRMKFISLLLIAALLTCISSGPVYAADGSITAVPPAAASGTVTSKDEVVYARMDSAGVVRGVYVVNILDVTTAGTVTDYGNYESVLNLTDLSPVRQENGLALLEAPVGRFYYQGNLGESVLPWAVTITYRLDGAIIAPEDLGGQSGQLTMEIQTTPQAGVSPEFFDNYLLQISLTLPGEVCNALSAPSGTVANVGEDLMVTFTSMPGEEGHFTIQCTVADFYLSGIDIAAVPFQMGVELPDTGQLTGGLSQLADGVTALRDGVSQLNQGVSKLGQGASSLASGSEQYKTGLTALSGQSAQLTMASQSILDGLNSMDSAFSGESVASPAGLEGLPTQLRDIAKGLRQTGAGLGELQQNYAATLKSLDMAIDAIPAYDLSTAELEALGQKAPNDPTLQKLIEVYSSAMTAKGTYGQVRDGLTATSKAPEELGGAIDQSAAGLEQMAKELDAAMSASGFASATAQLRSGMDTLVQSYTAFHQGLTDYTAGVVSLSQSYGTLNRGILGLEGGVSGLEEGGGTLLAGAEKLATETSSLPKQIELEIDKLASGYDTSGFVPVSFVSAQNQKIGSVTFVLRLDGVQRPTPPTPPVEPAPPESFWSRLRSLFL